MMLELSDPQLAMIMQAAAMAGTSDRKNFLRSVAGQLMHSQPSDPELAAALVWVLQHRNVSVSPHLFLNNKPRQKENYNGKLMGRRRQSGR